MSVQHMTAQRGSAGENILTCTSNLSIETSSPQSPAFHLHQMLSLPDSEFLPEAHNCCADIIEESACHADLLLSLLEHGEKVFVYGSCSKPCDGVFFVVGSEERRVG